MNRLKPWLQLASALSALSLPWAADPALQAAATLALWLATEALERHGRPHDFQALWTPGPRRLPSRPPKPARARRPSDSVVC